MPADHKIELLVITPERQVLDEAAESVVIPAHDGELGVLWNRAPLLCELGIGQLRYQRDGRQWRMYIDGGFAQVLDNRVTVLTNRALPAEKVTAEELAAAQRAAEAHQGHSPEVMLARERARRRVRELRRILAGA